MCHRHNMLCIHIVGYGQWSSHCHYGFLSMDMIFILYIYIYIWVNYNNSQPELRPFWGWFPLLTMIPVKSQWGRYDLPIYIYIYILYIILYTVMYIYIYTLYIHTLFRHYAWPSVRRQINNVTWTFHQRYVVTQTFCGSMNPIVDLR